MKTCSSYLALGLCSVLSTLTGCSTDDSSDIGTSGTSTGTSGTTTGSSGTSGGTGSTGTTGASDDGATIDSGIDSTVDNTDSGTTGSSEASTGDETAAADGASCGAFTTGSMTCDQCIQSNCCMAAAACDTVDSNGTDDAGFTSCEQLVSCVNDVCAADGGTLSDCESTCNTDYTMAEQASADALLSCVSMSCMAQCM